MSHGVKRARQTPEALEARRQKDASVLKEYLSLQDSVMAKKQSKDWSQDAFALTTQILRSNPELYTIWNYRRDIMANGLFPEKTPEERNNLLASDLQFTFSSLKQYPKVYWIWNHRRWCLQNTPDGPGEEGTTDQYGWKRSNWARELAVVEKMLDADARNFHAWNYRRYVVASSPDPRSEVAELAYTTQKIESNFSNFSAWHQRSKLLTSLWEKGEMTSARVKDGEFELLQHAMYSDPNDQSIWLYHRWLIGSGDDPAVLKREIKVVEELLEIEPDSKWCMECLVHYKRLLLRHDPEDARAIKEACLSTLKDLQRVDPQRRRRYEELASSFNREA
ncbi:Rab geranylgeranyltransferase [Tulasnella sp. JGI-2019a]|nr:Rab geranylgeranyltransferase [Tulasnella sp. JGI-2019a]KAG9040182.1 Rab geranylgeranyltransferase [Tulasnella sp. JGI-2019a]